MAEVKPARVGLIGCGDISASHIKTYQNVGIDVVAICDVDRARAQKRVDEFKLNSAEIYTDHRELLKRPDIDFVTVAVPVAFHAPLTIDALRAGKHVACEKPSTLSLTENRNIITEADKAQKKVIFFSSRNRWGNATLAKHYIDDGRLGEIYRVNVQYFRRRGRPGVDIIKEARWFINRKLSGGGAVMDMGQYFMDMVLNLTGWPTIDAASGTTYRGFENDVPSGVVYDVEEHCTILARSGKRLTFTFDLAWISNHPDVNSVYILGTKGAIKFGNDGFSFHNEESGPWRFIDAKAAWKDNTNSNDNIYRDFVSAIRGNDPGIGTTPRQALAITELTQMALQSADAGREITRAELKES